MFLHSELRKAIARHLLQEDALSALMNGPIRAKFGDTIPANITWGGTIYNVGVGGICYFESTNTSVDVTVVL